MIRPKPVRPKLRRSGLTSDLTLGVVGGGLAAASAAFGIGMTVHGPVTSLGTSGNFTVFAQFAGHHAPDDSGLTSWPSADGDDLDRTATASIPARGSEAGPPIGREASVTLRSASADSAVVLVDGRALTVRVGGTVPGAGTVLSIVGGSRPVLRTTRGLITATGQP